MARRVISFTGRDGTGVIPVPGLRVGDKIIVNSTIGGVVAASFAHFVFEDDELMQSEAADLSSTSFYLLVE